MKHHSFFKSDIGSETIDDSWINSRQKFAKCYNNNDHISKPPLLSPHELSMSLQRRTLSESFIQRFHSKATLMISCRCLQ